ncbi:MAG: helix-turn-helix transcriptional regulator [Colwellia sp.]|nr:helix-turn-helix transcriptional regulator [Colwellia sp.]
MITVNLLFKQIRTELGFTQKEMSNAMGLKKHNTISDYEVGKNIPLDKIYRMQAVYELLGESDQYLEILNNHIKNRIAEIKSNVTVKKRYL